MFEADNWEEIIKSHQYSRKEFKNGSWRYYYDKHNNFSRMTQCKSKTLKINSSMSTKRIVDVAKNYLANIWIADWKSHPEKAICKELKGKTVFFENISFEHINKKGGNSKGNNKYRSVENLVSHVKYLPCAKELLEERGIHTQSRYEKFVTPQKDGAVGVVYQAISGLAPVGDVNKYVQVTVSQKKYEDGQLGNSIYISVIGAKNIKKSTEEPCFKRAIAGQAVKYNNKLTPTPNLRQRNPTLATSLKPFNNLVNRRINISITGITEGNRHEKFEQLEKCLNGETPEHIPPDGTRALGNVNITLKNGSAERIEKALRTMSMSFGVPEKTKGEVFSYQAQEDLTNKWYAFFADFVRETYNFVSDYLGLPKRTLMSKSENLTHKGKILYYPETGEPIKKADWDKFVKNLENFLNRNIADAEKKIILESHSLGKILNRMLKYNTLEAVKKMQLDNLKYHGKDFDWISESTKNMKNVFGESLTRNEMTRIEMLTQSAGQKITGITDKIRNDVKQILIDGVRAHKSKGQVSQDLFDKMVGDNRDFQRLADTEIQNSVNNAFIREEVYNAKVGEKVYFQRIEVVDDNTCPFCKKMNGKIASWSERPLKDQKAKDSIADFVIWEGKEWNGQKDDVCTGVFHPFCRGAWIRYYPDLDTANINAMVAENSNRAKKWNDAVRQAKAEYKSQGIENPDDTTKGYIERITEIFTDGTVQKSLTYSGHKLQGRINFRGLNISIENKKGSIRRGTDSDGHKWAVRMHYDYGYIRGTEGVDGDHVDCYLGNNENAKNVYIIHQKIPGTNKYDEDKCMLGFDTLADAKAAYLRQYDKPGFLGGVSTVPFSVFKENIVSKKWHGKKLSNLT